MQVYQQYLCTVEASTVLDIQQMFCETPRLVSLEFEHLAQAVMEEFEISAPTSIPE